MKKQYKRAFLLFFALVSLLPLLQQVFHPLKLAGLQGAFEKGTMPLFTVNSWLEGTYQQQTDIYLKYNTAFNGELVRLRNQVDYTLFGNINTVLTLGKDNYIFDPNYIIAREGRDILPSLALDSLRIQLKAATEFTSSMNIKLLVCFAPNKANFYSDFLPAPSIPASVTNRTAFQAILDSNLIPYIDFDSWFLKLKNVSNFTLVPKYGAHWSTYGAMIATDSLLNKLTALISKPVASFRSAGVVVTTDARHTDDDYLPSLNLMTRWASPPLAYPELKFIEGYKPNVLIISDSFIWNLYDLEVTNNCLDEKSTLRYYNRTTFDVQKNNLGPAKELLTTADIQYRDVIIILTSDPGLKDPGFGFFRQLHHLQKMQLQ